MATAPAPAGQLARLRAAASRLFRRPRGPGELLAVLLIAATAGGGIYTLYWLGKHALAIRRLTRGVGDTVFLSADGRPWFRLDERRHDVPLADVSPHLRHAVIAAEDHRFYRHTGIDAIGLARALLRNLRERRIVEGGSTLTQQLARTLFLSNRRSLGRKAKEAILAAMLEQSLSKDQILELYLNRVYLGGDIYGVEAMSRELYRKRARDLSAAEAALIAGVIQAPSALSPWSNLQGALARSHIVLGRMREAGYLSEEDLQKARAAAPRIKERSPPISTGAGYAKQYLRELFREQVGEDNPPDWQVHTTFLPALQRAAEQTLARGLRERDAPGLQAALVALDAHTGAVLALVGGADFGLSPFNRAVHSRRQPGSAFKPFVFAAALEKGLSPVSILEDLRRVETGSRGEWSLHNSADGPEEETLREALLISDNRAAVALQQRVGSKAVLRVASRAGLRNLPDVPSLALGTGLVTPLDLTAAFAVFPNGGWALRPRAIVRVLDADGDVAFADAQERKRVLSAPAAFQALSMLRDVAERGTASAARALGFPVGGKTGTTDDFKDAWFVGFSSDTVAGVWVGFDQPATIAEDGYAARVALPIWMDFMRRAAHVRPPGEFAIPAGLTEVEMCRVSYGRALADCPAYVEYFKDGDEVPERTCPVHGGGLRRRLGRALGDLVDRLKRIFR